MRKWIAVFGLVILCLLLPAIWATNLLYEPPQNALTTSARWTVTRPDNLATEVPAGWNEGSLGNTAYQKGVYKILMRMRAETTKLDHADKHVLVFPMVNGTGIRVYFNGSYLGEMGDMRKGNANIWNRIKIFALPPDSLREENEIKAELYGVYSAGLPRAPFVIPVEGNRIRLFFMGFLSNWLLWFVSGACFMMGAILLLIGSSSFPKFDARFILGLASIFTALFLSDFMFLEYLPIPLVEFKRLTVLFRHGAALLFLPGYLSLLERKPGLFTRIFCASQVLCIAALMIPRNMIMLKAFYTFTYLSVIPLPLYLTWIIFRHRLARIDHLVLLVGAFTASVLSLIDSIIPMFNPAAMYMSQYGYLILILSATGFVVLDILHHYRLLLLERIRSEQYREERLHDPLTGVFNRSVMDLLVDNLPASFSVIIADLNNFKAINDTYGHPIGDIVLKDTAHLMKRIFRRNDMIIRTGGDEFLIVLPDCPEEKASELIGQLHEAIALSPVTLPDNKNFSYSISTGSAYTGADEIKSHASLIELVSRADKAMYLQKTSANK